MPSPPPRPDRGGGRSARPGTFAALGVRNFRVYMGGQSVSLVGTWMQSVAQAWLVLELTHSGTALGLVTAAQFVPVLVLAGYGGLVADRRDKRRILLATQTAFGALALLLGILTVAHVVQLWMVFVVAVGFGLANAFDNPARQAFAVEMVGRPLVRNAVSLNSVTVNMARAVGPAVAGVLIATVGVGVCFLLNAASYVAVIAALMAMDVHALRPSPPAGREPGQLRDGLRYVRRTPDLLVPLLMMGLIGTLAYEFQVVLPLFATDVLHGDSRTFGFMTAAMGIGAVAGGLVVAARAGTGLRAVTVAAVAFAVTIAGAAVAPNLAVELVMLVLVGAASISFISLGNASLQLASEPRYRGRVMALWAVAFLGSTPVGGPVVGAISQTAGPRLGLAVGAAACAVAAAMGAVALARGVRAVPARRASSQVAVAEPEPVAGDAAHGGGGA